MLYVGLPLSLPHLVSQKAAEKIAMGDMLYRDIWCNLPPISGWLLGYLEWLSPSNMWLNGAIAIILVGYQTYVLTRMSLELDLFTERNYTPGLIYILVASVVPDFLTLSPALISLTLIIPAFARMAKHLRVGVAEDEMLSTGLLLGCAALCHLPASLLIVWLMLVYALYSGATLRHYVLLALGVFLPNVLVFLFWFWVDAGTDYYYNYIRTIIGGSNHLYLNGYQVVMLLLAPLLFWVLALLRIYSLNRFINYQSVMQTVMVLWIIVGILAISISFDGTPDECLIILPPIAFMLTHYFQSLQRTFVTEISFGLFMGAMVGTLMIATLQPAILEPSLPISDLYLSPRLAPKGALTDQQAKELSGQKVWVLGHNYRYYQYAKLGSPYLDLDLAQRDFTEMDHYDVVSNVYQRISADLPDVIIDQAHLADSLFVRMPILAKEYVRKAGNGQPYYIRKIVGG